MARPAASETEAGAAYIEGGEWSNWAGNIRSHPAYIVKAQTENDVLGAVRYAIKHHLQVRVVGSGHSWTGLGETDGVLIDVRNIRHFHVSDRERKRVVMGAGVSIWEAGEQLWDEGFSLKNQGDIDVQTVAGAASTGTHGSGSTLANLASSIKRIKLVNGLGDLVEITEDQEDVLRAARIALGTMGVFIELEFEVTDAYYLEEEVTFPSWNELVDRWESNLSENRHLSFFWFPTSDSPALYDIPVPDEVQVVDHAHLRRINIAEGPARQIDEQRRVDRNYIIFHGEFTGPYYEFEYFVPANRALEVMTELRRNVLEHHPEEKFPIQPRWIKGDDSYLSPCYGVDSVGISISGNASTDYLAWLRKMDETFARFGARPHWGKFHFFNRDKAIGVFPEYDTFNRIRLEYDPNGIFLNKLTGELFGQEPGQGPKGED